MNKFAPDNVTAWISEPMPRNVRDRVQRLAANENVAHVAVMPDVHLSAEYCVGTAVATHTRLFPQAVGGDIGCGMLAVRLDCDAELVSRRAGN